MPRGHDLGVGNTGRAGLMFGADERKEVVRVVEGGSRKWNVSRVLLLRNLHFSYYEFQRPIVLSHFSSRSFSSYYHAACTSLSSVPL